MSRFSARVTHDERVGAVHLPVAHFATLVALDSAMLLIGVAVVRVIANVFSHVLDLFKNIIGVHAVRFVVHLDTLPRWMNALVESSAVFAGLIPNRQCRLLAVVTIVNTLAIPVIRLLPTVVFQMIPDVIAIVGNVDHDFGDYGG